MTDAILHRYQVVNLDDETNVFATRSQKRPACVLAMALASATGASWGVRDTLHKSGPKIVESYQIKK